MKQTKTLGVILAVSGILLFSSKAVMVKLAYQYEVDSISLLLLRMVFAFPFYLVISIIKRPREPIQSNDYLWLLGLGMISYYLASYFDFLGLQYIKASLERLILFIYPTLVILMSYVFLGKSITRKQALGVLVTYLGVVIIFSSELAINQEDQVLYGAILIFLSALTYAGFLTGSGWIIPKFGATVFTSYAMMISCACVVVHYLFTKEVSILSFPAEVYWIGLAMAVFATVIPSYLISYAIKMLGANNFSVFGSLGPVSTIVLAYLFLDESLTMIQLAGSVVVIAGIFLAEKRKKG